MYPYEILPGIDLYVILLSAAAVAAIVLFRVFADKLNIEAQIQNLCIFDAVASIVFGYFSAVLFQAVYNIPERGKFEITSDTGATFYGGLIGGAACFLFVYFFIGRFVVKDGLQLRRFYTMSDAAAVSITAAHSIGRIGCLMAGCCYGAKTDAWYGIYMVYLGHKVIPTQLYEAIFLALFCVYLITRILRGKTYNLPLYMMIYGVWRFFLEYLRDDYRGQTLIPFLTPSQLTALLMIAGGAVLYFFQRRYVKRHTDSCNNDFAEEKSDNG